MVGFIALLVVVIGLLWAVIDRICFLLLWFGIDLFNFKIYSFNSEEAKKLRGLVNDVVLFTVIGLIIFNILWLWFAKTFYKGLL